MPINLGTQIQAQGVPGVYKVLNDQSDTAKPIQALNVAAVITSKYGEAGIPIELTSKSDLVETFGTPTDDNYEEWYQIYRIWDYGVGTLGAYVYAVRPIGANSKNAVLSVTSAEVVADASRTAEKFNNKIEAQGYTPTFETYNSNKAIVKFATAYPTDQIFHVAMATADDFVNNNAEVVTGKTFASVFTDTPVGTEVAVAVLDESLNILSTYIVDLQPGNKDGFGVGNYIGDVLAQRDRYVVAFKNEDASLLGVDPKSFTATPLSGGVYDAPIAADYVNALNIFSNADIYDINYFIAHANLLQETKALVETRGDCTFRAAAPKHLVINQPIATALKNVLDWSNGMVSSYAPPPATPFGSVTCDAILIDDLFSGKKRWISPVGDLVGLRIRQNLSASPWFSDAGLNYGLLNNVLRFAQNWQAAQIKQLVKARFNFLVQKSGVGNVKFYDQTWISKNSALKDEGVAELIVYLWRTGKQFLQYKLFEFNDEFTRAQVEAQLRTLLRSVQDGRGIRRTSSGEDGFFVRCDESNNPDAVINNGILVADLAFIPARSIKEIYFRLTVAEGEIQLSELAS
jgi:hypothetical protein